MNKKLKNWFRIFDEGSVLTKARNGGVESKPLKPVKKEQPKEVAKMKPAPAPKESQEDSEDKEIADMSYMELLQKFEAEASKNEQKEINGGKKPKKKQILEFFNA